MWQPKGAKGTILVKTNTGRKRINIIGGLDYKNMKVITTLTEEKCNKYRIVEFLEKIRQEYSDKNIVIILDNAKYNLAEYTTKFAEWYGIELFFLPPYSPNLNLIERLWKFSKKKLVHNKYYEKFKEFTENATNFFNNINIHTKELTNILTQKFEIIHTD